MKIKSYFVSQYTSDDTIRVSWALTFNTIDVCPIIIPLQTSLSLALRYKCVSLLYLIFIILQLYIVTLITKFSNMYQHCYLCVVYFQTVEILQL